MPEARVLRSKCKGEGSLITVEDPVKHRTP